MSAEGFETIAQMKLEHLPNDAKLVLQRQKSEIIGNRIQFGLPSTFLNSENGQTVWNKGPSIQLEQIPELIKMLQDAYERYAKQDTKKEKTVTFADAVYTKF